MVSINMCLKNVSFEPHKKEFDVHEIDLLIFLLVSITEDSATGQQGAPFACGILHHLRLSFPCRYLHHIYTKFVF